MTRERSGDLTAAAESYREALRLDVGYVEAHKNLGRLHEKEGDLAAAERRYRTALSLRRRYPEVRASLGNVLANRGKLPAAVRELERAIAGEPQNAEARQKLGVVYGRLGDLRRAAEHLEEAVRLQPEVAMAHNNLGLVLSLAGKPVAAERRYTEAIRLDAEYASAHSNLANLHASEGNVAAATQCFRTALRLAHEQANSGLAREIQGEAASSGRDGPVIAAFRKPPPRRALRRQRTPSGRLRRSGSSRNGLLSRSQCNTPTNPPTPTRQGFSLLEILIIAAVIATVVAVSIPSFMNSKKTAYEAQAVSFLRMASTVLERHHFRYGSYPDTLADLEAAGMGLGRRRHATRSLRRRRRRSSIHLRLSRPRRSVDHGRGFPARWAAREIGSSS